MPKINFYFRSLILFVLYFLLAVFAIYLSRQPGNIATLWFSNGLGSAFLFSHRLKAWPLLITAIVLGNLAANFLVGDPLDLSLSFAVANTLESILAAFLLKKFCLPENSLSSPTQIFRFIALGAFLPPLIGGTLGAWTVSLHGLAPFGKVWLAWYEGSVIGSVAMLPLATGLLLGDLKGKSKEIFSIKTGLTLLISSGTTFFSLTQLSYPFVYIIIPLIFGAVYLRLVSLSLVNFMVTIIIGLTISNGLFTPPAFTRFWESLLIYMPITLSLIPPLVLASSLEQNRLVTHRLARSELLYRELANKNSIQMWTIDTAFNLKSFNESFKQSFFKNWNVNPKEGLYIFKSYPVETIPH